MTKLFVDYAKLQDRQQKACQEARERLKTKGLVFPVYTSAIQPDAYHKLLMAYSEAEANLVVEILREPEGGLRPFVMDNVAPRKMGWDGYSD